MNFPNPLMKPQTWLCSYIPCTQDCRIGGMFSTPFTDVKSIQAVRDKVHGVLY